MVEYSECCNAKIVGHFETDQSRLETLICSNCGEIIKKDTAKKTFAYKNCHKGEFNDIQDWGRPKK